MTTPDPNKGSEYGGVGGRIQPPPHDPTDVASEILGLTYGTNPSGITSGQRVMTPDETDPVVPQTRRIR